MSHLKLHELLENNYARFNPHGLRLDSKATDLINMFFLFGDSFRLGLISMSLVLIAKPGSIPMSLFYIVKL